MLVKYVPIYGNTYHFVKNTYVFTASMYVLVLLLMACHKDESWQEKSLENLANFTKLLNFITNQLLLSVFNIFAKLYFSKLIFLLFHQSYSFVKICPIW